ncbi:MAG TPA: NAD(+) kinase, partial [Fibrobacteria bacterium]|nr:NAD(+) kinase [Fibrobacteria bacterium]
MAEAFKRVGLIGKYADASVGETLQAIATFLNSHQVEVYLDEATAHMVPGHGLPVATREQIG